MKRDADILCFEEAYFERIWGGRRLVDRYGKRIPANKSIGEAWLISDHPNHRSIVASGPEAGRSLHDLVSDHRQALLGSNARLTRHGRFPLLLKILDANDYLSIQVHPDDAAAGRLGERDGGKTEMWYVLDAAERAELICGTKNGIGREEFTNALDEDRLVDVLVQFPVQPGDAVFVEAGTVHAIAPGSLLAEIQQNSDITYRLYDWGRTQADGTPRQLHINKALEVTRFDSVRSGKRTPLEIEDGGALRRVLGACGYFAAEAVEIAGEWTRDTRGASFHLLLSVSGEIAINAGKTSQNVAPGEAVLIPGHAGQFTAHGTGMVLDYYVPDMAADIIRPLESAGHNPERINALLGSAPGSA